MLLCTQTAQRIQRQHNCAQHSNSKSSHGLPLTPRMHDLQPFFTRATELRLAGRRYRSSTKTRHPVAASVNNIPRRTCALTCMGNGAWSVTGSVYARPKKSKTQRVSLVKTSAQCAQALQLCNIWSSLPSGSSVCPRTSRRRLASRPVSALWRRCLPCFFVPKFCLTRKAPSVTSCSSSLNRRLS